MTGDDLLMRELRELYAVEPSEGQWDAARANVLAALDAEEAAEAAAPVSWAPPRRSGSRVPRRMAIRVAIAVAIVVLATAAAYAAPKVIEWFDRSASIQDNVGALRSDAERMTEAEYASLEAMSEPLAPRDESRVLIDDQKLGRITLVPFADGRGYCSTNSEVAGAPRVSSDGDVQWGKECSPEVGELGVGITSGFRLGQPLFLYGYAVDAVRDLAVVRSDGVTDEVSITNNAYVWRAPDFGIYAKRLEFTVNGERRGYAIPAPMPESLRTPAER